MHAAPLSQNTACGSLGQLRAGPYAARKIQTRVLGHGALSRRYGHFQRVLQQYCVYKQKRVCRALPRLKGGARSRQSSPGTFGAYASSTYRP